MEDFIDVLAAWHRLDPRSLNVGLQWPATAEECALNRPMELSVLTGDPGVEPLRTFGMWWIRRHVPRPLREIVLVQGDTGPGNFIFEDGRVKAVTDWEWARFGDPMEDLGTICCRCLFFAPDIRLEPLFRRYEKESGITIDFDRVRFYRAQQMVQSVIALVAVTHDLDPAGPAAMNVAYRVRGDFVCCHAIAEAMGMELAEPVWRAEPPPSVVPSFDLLGATLHILDSEVIASLTDRYVQERARWAGGMAETMEHRAQLGPELAHVELEDLGRLVGRPSASVADGLAELDRHIAGWGDGGPSGHDEPSEEAVLGYLWRRACRNEELYEPLLRFLPARRFSAIGGT